MKIEVFYDGKYPCSCMGTLIIKVDDKEIYNKKYCCKSTGSAYFINDYQDEVVETGELEWEDANKFSKEIRKAVECELSKVRVCCGGCL